MIRYEDGYEEGSFAWDTEANQQFCFVAEFFWTGWTSFG